MASSRAELLVAPQMASQKLRVVETDPSADPRWESFVLNHPNGSIYHHPAWLKALEREYSQKGMHLACEDSDGQLLGVLPLLYTRGLPFGLGNPLTGRRLSSLPRTPVAGPLSRSSHATLALLQEAVRRVRSTPGVQLQIKMQDNELDGVDGDLVCTPWRLSYVLRLTTNSDGPFKVADGGHRYTIKKAVNKAKRLGVHVRSAETLSDLRTWYDLYLDTMRRNVVPARPYRFFIALWELLRPKAMMKLLIAEREQSGATKMIGGTIFLHFGRTVSCAFNGTWVSDLSLRPNDIIYWEAINDACRNGFQLFDFGEVAEGRPELARYKLKWGSDATRLYRYYCPLRHNSETAMAEPGGYPKAFANAIWRRLPLPLTSWLGNRIYAYL